MGRKKQPLKPGPPSQPLPAQGKGACKRTPASSFDPAAGKDTYEPEKIVVMLHVALVMYQNLAPLIRIAFDQDPSDPAEARKYGEMVMEVLMKGLQAD